MRFTAFKKAKAQQRRWKAFLERLKSPESIERAKQVLIKFKADRLARRDACAQALSTETGLAKDECQHLMKFLRLHTKENTVATFKLSNLCVVLTDSR